MNATGQPDRAIKAHRVRFLWPPPVRGMRAAFVFLSRIPLGGFPYRDADWRWAPAHFPLVGLVIGSVTAGVYAAGRGLGLLVSATLALVVSVLLTGAFHEDGLADTADALGGPHRGERMLDILKDSRVGTYGAVAVTASLLLRVLCIAELDQPWLLPLMACAARTGPVWLMASLPYVSGAGAKAACVSQAGPRQAVVASIWPVALVGAFGFGGRVTRVQGAVVLVAVATVTLFVRRWFRLRAGGITGDFLGATEQGAEAFALLGLLVLERAGS